MKLLNSSRRTIPTHRLVISLLFFSLSASAAPPSAKIRYVGAIAVNPCQDSKIIAEWYTRFGIETKGFQDGGFYGRLDTEAGPLIFGIHPAKAQAAKHCSPNVSIVYRVDDFDGSLLALKGKGLLPDSAESNSKDGRFAHFHDPDGNEVTLWGD